MADYKRSGARYGSGYHSNNWSNSTREYTMERDCSCNRQNYVESIPTQWKERFPLGMAYVPIQHFENIYEMEVGLQRGTIFSQIDYPFEIGFCARGCQK